MRILVLGGTGFIGAQVVDALRGHDIVVFHRSGTCPGDRHVRHLHGDRRYLESYRASFRAFLPDVVVDMVPRNGADARRVVAAVAGTCGALVAVSSVSVYRSFGVLVGTEVAPVDNTPAPETAPLRRRLFPYRGAEPRPADDPLGWLDTYDKIPAERVLTSCAAMPSSIVRLPMVYGPGDPDGRLGPYVRRMLDRRPVVVLGRSASAWRNSRCYVVNAAAAIARLTLSSAGHGTYNVAEPESLAEADWIRSIGQHVGWGGEVVVVEDTAEIGLPPLAELPRHANFAQHLVADGSRIREALGYRETVPPDEGLRISIDDAARRLPAIDYAPEDEWLAARRATQI